MRTLLIAITSPLKVSGLQEILSAIPELVPLAVTQDARATVNALRTRRPDVLAVDHAIGREVAGLLTSTHRLPRTLIIGGQRHVGLCPGKSPNPACGFAARHESTARLTATLRYLATCPRPHADRVACQFCPVRKTLQRPKLPLSSRESDVFERIARGDGVTAIAEALGLSVKTVETYRASIKRKLGLATAHDLLRAAIQWELGEFQPLAPT